MLKSKSPWLIGRIFLAGLILLSFLVALLYRPDIPVEDLRETYTDESSQFFEVGGRPVHFRDQGQGPPLVLLHGTAASLHTWDQWVDVLQNRHRVIRLDLPGFGLTGPGPQNDHTTAGRIEAIRALLAHLDIDSFALAGSSLGGFIAWNYALTYPEQVSALVLIDAAGLAPADPEESGGSIFDLGRIPLLNKVLTRVTPRFLVSKGLRQVYGDPSLITEEQVDRYHDLLLRVGNRRALVESLNQKNQINDVNTLSGFKQPALIQWGEVDRWIPVADAHRFQELLPHAKLVIYPNIGHILMEEIPERSAEDVAKFLAAIKPPAEGPLTS